MVFILLVSTGLLNGILKRRLKGIRDIPECAGKLPRYSHHRTDVEKVEYLGKGRLLSMNRTILAYSWFIFSRPGA
jgi:hypothetical protein